MNIDFRLFNLNYVRKNKIQLYLYVLSNKMYLLFTKKLNNVLYTNMSFRFFTKTFDFYLNTPLITKINLYPVVIIKRNTNDIDWKGVFLQIPFKGKKKLYIDNVGDYLKDLNNGLGL